MFNQTWGRLRSHEESEATITLDMHEIRTACYNTMLVKLNIPQAGQSGEYFSLIKTSARALAIVCSY